MLALTACGGPAVPRPVRPATPEVHRYLPTDLREASRTPGVGLVIGSDVTGQSAVFELAPLPRQVAITVARAQAGMAQLTLAAGAPPRFGAPAVIGLPVVVACRTLGKAIAALPLALATEPAGDIDLDQHGAALAAGWIAAATGAAPGPDVLVLGGLSLDGSVLPVPDAAAIIARAAAAGIRVVGVAPGTALPADLAIEVVVIADVDDAYALLTDHALPRSQPLAEADLGGARPVVDDAADVTRWLGATADASGSIAALTGRLLAIEQQARTPRSLQALARSARSGAVEARGVVPPMGRILARAALLRARVVVMVADVLRAVDRGDLAAAIAMTTVLAPTAVPDDPLAAAFAAITTHRLDVVRALLDAPDAARTLAAARRTEFVDAAMALVTWTELAAAWRDGADLLGLPAAADAPALAPADSALLDAALGRGSSTDRSLDAALGAQFAASADGLWLRDQARSASRVAALADWPLLGAATGPDPTVVAAAAHRALVLAGRLRVLTGSVPAEVASAYAAAAALPLDLGAARILALRGFRRAAWLADLAVAAALGD